MTMSTRRWKSDVGRPYITEPKLSPVSRAGSVTAASAKPCRLQLMSISLGFGSTRAIAGVGATVAIGWPSRLRTQEAPDGVVPTRISVLSGCDEQPQSTAAQRAARINA